MLAPFPPSSSVSFFTLPAAARMTCLPTSVEPVNATLRTSGCAASRAPTMCPGPVTTFSTPGGKPTSCAARASSSSVSGVWASGLTTTVFPAARAGPSFHTASSRGKFHGTMPAQTPTGSFRISPVARPGAEMTGPAASNAYERASDAKYLRCAIEEPTRKLRAPRTVAPFSLTCRAVSSSRRAAMLSAIASIRSARSCGVLVRHTPLSWAALAAATAASTLARSP